ncbi:MAG: helix-turn-helix transcriptional regulator [Chloroflexota bacterium]|nr:helix-turn-helix transcriptional regulator [Chloroflexota bacterium]
MRPPTPAAEALANRFATRVGVAIGEERIRRGWTTRDVASRARVSAATISNVEAGRRASLDVYARIAEALGLSLDVSLENGRRRRTHDRGDLVHAAMGETEAGWLRALGYEVAIDHPYQHYQFAGRADVLAWTLEPSALLHIENRTRFPDLQEAAGAYNAKRQYLARVVADQLGIPAFASQTHVMVGLWSAEVIHSVRLRSATFHALGPHGTERLDAWLKGDRPSSGTSSSVVLLDLFASSRQATIVGLEHVLAGVRPRVRGYREAAERLRAEGRA